MESEEFIFSTTHQLQGYRVSKYISVETAEVVMGSGALTEMMGAIADTFGVRSRQHESKLDKARTEAFDHIKEKAMLKGANAAIGLGIEITTFDKTNQMGVIVTATAVSVAPEINELTENRAPPAQIQAQSPSSMKQEKVESKMPKKPIDTTSKPQGKPEAADQKKVQASNDEAP